MHIETPLLESRPLSAVTGSRIWLKLEALQPTGSFKNRGMGLACETYFEWGARRFVTSSGGNAGLAVAYAGRKLGVPVTVVVPGTTSERAMDLLRLEGAEVLVHGESWQESNDHALSLLDDAAAYLHPFDDELVWRGHASMMDEVRESGLQPDLVVLSVGGGGLLCGVAEGMHRNGWAEVPIIAVETKGAASFHAAVQAGRPVKLERLTSIATTLGAKQVCDKAFEWTKAHDIRPLLVSDGSAVAACERFLDDHRLLVEPACGASLAPVYEQSDALKAFNTVLVIVCGGATVNLEQLRKFGSDGC